VSSQWLPALRGRLARSGPLLVGLLLALVAARVYLSSSQRTFLDPKYSLLTAESLLISGSFDLAPYLPHLAAATEQETSTATLFSGDLPYQLVALDGRLLYIYPPGGIFFSLPPMWLARQLGWSTLTPDGIYSSQQALRLHALFAAWIAALTVWVVHRIALRELPLLPATLVALAAAFGTELWGTASRTLWTHTWAALWVAFAWLELLRWDDGLKRRPLWLAFALSAAVWCRPTTLLIAIPVVLYLALRHRPALVRVFAGGLVGAAAMLVYNLFVWHSSASTYATGHAKMVASRKKLSVLLERFVDQFVSSEHGLLVLYPVLFAVALVLVVYRIAPHRRTLAALALVAIAAHLLLYIRMGRWWGGGTPGNRFLTELAPLMAWLGAHAWRRTRERWSARPPARSARAAVVAATVLLLAAGVAAQTAGALRMRWPRTDRARRAAGIERAEWNRRPAGYWMQTPQAKLVVWLGREWWPSVRSRTSR